MGSCGNCRYHDNYTGACSNGMSEKRGDFTENHYCCDAYKTDDETVIVLESLVREIHEMNTQLRRISGRI